MRSELKLFFHAVRNELRMKPMSDCSLRHTLQYYCVGIQRHIWYINYETIPCNDNAVMNFEWTDRQKDRQRDVSQGKQDGLIERGKLSHSPANQDLMFFSYHILLKYHIIAVK